MKPTNRLALALALACSVTAMGCGADPAAMPGGGSGGSNSGDDDDPGTQPAKPLDATGKYAVHSTFDLATNMPGTAGQVVNTIIAATDGANDPTQWILEQLLAKLPDAVKPYAGLIAAVAAPAINKKLDSLLPGIRTTIELVGSDFGSIAKQFGLNETLELTRSGDGYTAVHTVTGVHFKLDNQDVDLALTNYHVSNVVVNNVAVTMDATGQLTIAAHDIPLAYGQILRIGLDAAIIPLIDSSAQNLNQLLTHEIDCQLVGKAIADEIVDLVSADTLASACRSGLEAAANLVYLGIDAVDGTALNFGVSGSARGADKNKDRNIDTIQTGTWSGTLSYGSTPAPLVPATFFGERM
jgi:hypothetical protein